MGHVQVLFSPVSTYSDYIKKLILFYILIYNNKIFKNEIRYKNIIFYLLIIYINLYIIKK